MKRRVAFYDWDWRWAFRWPHLALRELWDEACAFVERGLYGYAEQDRWSLCAYLMRWLPCAIAEMAEKHVGYPGDITAEEWEAVLRQLASDLEAGWQLEELEWDTNEEHNALDARFQRGIDSLRLWFWDLWD